jgi:PIN domain nuclease of toxin-antitoxin system
MIDGQGPILFWLQSGQLDKFSQGTVEHIRQAGAAGMLRVSIISVWEIALLESKDRIWISIRMDCLEWVRRALETSSPPDISRTF